MSLMAEAREVAEVAVVAEAAEVAVVADMVEGAKAAEAAILLDNLEVDQGSPKPRWAPKDP